MWPPFYALANAESNSALRQVCTINLKRDERNYHGNGSHM